MSNQPDKILSALTELYNDSKASWQEAYDWICKKADHRNNEAFISAFNHRNMVEKALLNYRRTLDVGAAIEDIYSALKITEQWYADYRRWGGDKNEYAWVLHDKAADRYRKVHRMLRDTKVVPMSDDAHPAASSLYLLFGTEGGSDGMYKEGVVYHQGHDSKTNLDTEVFDKVWTKASASADVLIGKVEVDGGTEFSGRFNYGKEEVENTMEEHSLDMEIDLSKPCYIYQLQTIVPMEAGEPITLRGNIVQSPKLIAGAKNGSAA